MGSQWRQAAAAGLPKPRFNAVDASFPDYPQVAAPADVFTCLADPYTRETAQILGRQVVTMPNSIRSFELPTAPKTNKIVVLSRLDEAKHLDRLIQAFAQVQGQVKEAGSWLFTVKVHRAKTSKLWLLICTLVTALAYLAVAMT